MANQYVNKVVQADGTVLMDISDTTATADTILQGYTAYGKNGQKITGIAQNKSLVVTDTEDSHGGTVRTITAQDSVLLLGNKTVTPSSEVQIVTANETPLDISTSENTATGTVPAYITTNIQWQSEPVVGTTYNVVVNCTVNGRYRTYSYDGTVVWNGYGSTTINMRTSTGTYTPVGTFNETTFVIQHSDSNGETENNSPITIQMYTEGYDGLAQVTVEAVKPYPYCVDILSSFCDYGGYILYKENRYPDVLSASNPLLLVDPGDSIQIVVPNQLDYFITSDGETISSGTGNINYTYPVNYTSMYINAWDTGTALVVEIVPLELFTNTTFGAGQSDGFINIQSSSEPFVTRSGYNEYFTNGRISYCSFRQNNYSDLSASMFIPIGAYVFINGQLSGLSSSISVGDIKVRTTIENANVWEDFDLSSFNDISINVHEEEFYTEFYITYKNNVPITGVSCQIVN